MWNFPWQITLLHIKGIERLSSKPGVRSQIDCCDFDELVLLDYQYLKQLSQITQNCVLKYSDCGSTLFNFPSSPITLLNRSDFLLLELVWTNNLIYRYGDTVERWYGMDQSLLGAFHFPVFQSAGLFYTGFDLAHKHPRTHWWNRPFWDEVT